MQDEAHDKAERRRFRDYLALIPSSARWVGGIFLLTWLIYLLFVPRFLRYSSPPTGDQPFYLMDTISLVQDGDLELSNNYAQHDEDKFYRLAPHPADFVGLDAPYPLPPQIAVAQSRPAHEMYSYHPPGLGLLLVPAWIIGSWFALWWPATVVFMCLIGALVATNLFLLAYETTQRRGVALIIWGTLAFSSPLMSYSYLLFSEMPTGLLTIYIFRRLALGWRANGAGRLLLLGLGIGYIPWLAVRCTPIAAGLGLYAAAQWWAGRPRTTAAAGAPTWRTQARLWLPTLWIIGPVVGLAGALAAYHLFLNGTVLPPLDEQQGTGVGGFYWPWASGHDLYQFITGSIGLLFSQRFGLLPYAPVYLLAAGGAVAMWRTRQPADRRLLGWIALVSLPYMTFIAAYSGWGGDWGPPARYAATLVPLLAAPLAVGLAALASSRIYRLLYAACALIGGGFMAVMLYDARTMFSHTESAILRWLAVDPHTPFAIDLRPLLPQFITPDETWHPWRTGGLLIFGSLIVGLNVLLLTRHSHRVGGPAPPQWPAWAQAGLTLGLLTVLGAAWGIRNYDFLRPKTTLTPVGQWVFAGPLKDTQGIAYLDGKVYIARRGRREPTEVPGTVGILDLAGGQYTEWQPHSADGRPLAWAHPGSVTHGPDGLLYVLNNGPGDQALLGLTPAGQVVRQIALDQTTGLGMGLTFGSDSSSFYVADQLRGVVFQYGADGGAPLAIFHGQDAVLNNPQGLALDQAGNIYTSETVNQIQKLDSQGTLRLVFQLNCAPFYFADAPGPDPWFEVSCSTGVVSLNTAENYVQFTHVTGSAPLWVAPRGITYSPDSTLYVLDESTLSAFRVAH
ncbi:MAG: hypothetical protein M3Z04_23135 [Chloroflexota bacterium]|nr:hypothetical protein [Chloroflexota bacterium]